MALKTAAFLKWKLALFEKELPVATIHQLLTEFLKACKTSIPPAIQVTHLPHMKFYFLFLMIF